MLSTPPTLIPNSHRNPRKTPMWRGRFFLKLCKTNLQALATIAQSLVSEMLVEVSRTLHSLGAFKTADRRIWAMDPSITTKYDMRCLSTETFIGGLIPWVPARIGLAGRDACIETN